MSDLKITQTPPPLSLPPSEESTQPDPSQNILITTTCSTLIDTLQNLTSLSITSVSETSNVTPPYSDKNLPQDINLLYDMLILYNYFKQHPNATDPTQWPPSVQAAKTELNIFFQSHVGALNSLENLASWMYTYISANPPKPTDLTGMIEGNPTCIPGFINYLFSNPNFPSLFTKDPAIGDPGPKDLAYFLNMSYLLIESIKTIGGTAPKIDDSLWFQSATGGKYFPSSIPSTPPSTADIIDAIVAYLYQKGKASEETVGDFKNTLNKLAEAIPTAATHISDIVASLTSPLYPDSQSIGAPLVVAWYDHNPLNFSSKETSSISTWKIYPKQFPDVSPQNPYEAEAKVVEWIAYLYHFLQQAQGTGGAADKGILEAIRVLQSLSTNPICNADTKALLKRILDEFKSQTGMDPATNAALLNPSTLSTYKTAFNASFISSSGYAITSYNLIVQSLPDLYKNWTPAISLSIISWASGLKGLDLVISSSTIPGVAKLTDLANLFGFPPDGSPLTRPPMYLLGPAMLAYFYQLNSNDSVKALQDFQAFIKSLPSPSAASPPINNYDKFIASLNAIADKFHNTFHDSWTEYSAASIAQGGIQGIDIKDLLSLWNDVSTGFFNYPSIQSSSLAVNQVSLLATASVTPPDFDPSIIIPPTTGDINKDLMALLNLINQAMLSSDPEKLLAALKCYLNLLAAYKEKGDTKALTALETALSTKLSGGQPPLTLAQMIIKAFTDGTFYREPKTGEARTLDNLKNLIDTLTSLSGQPPGAFLNELKQEAIKERESLVLNPSWFTARWDAVNQKAYFFDIHGVRQELSPVKTWTSFESAYLDNFKTTSGDIGSWALAAVNALMSYSPDALTYLNYVFLPFLTQILNNQTVPLAVLQTLLGNTIAMITNIIAMAQGTKIVPWPPAPLPDGWDPKKDIDPTQVTTWDDKTLRTMWDFFTQIKKFKETVDAKFPAYASIIDGAYEQLRKTPITFKDSDGNIHTIKGDGIPGGKATTIGDLLDLIKDPDKYDANIAKMLAGAMLFLQPGALPSGFTPDATNWQNFINSLTAFKSIADVSPVINFQIQNLNTQIQQSTSLWQQAIQTLVNILKTIVAALKISQA